MDSNIQSMAPNIYSSIPTVYACHPTYAAGHPQSHKQFWRKAIIPGDHYASTMNVMLEDKGSSLLPDCFNDHWCKALNLQLAGVPITRWAMLHDDIVPMDGWLSKLLGILDRTGADLVAAVNLIKDSRFLTSTALEDADDEWLVWRRLTLKECRKLPQTFDATDCAKLLGDKERALLANTGCWVCDFTKPWRFQVCFENPCRLVFQPAGTQDILPISEYKEGMKGAFNHQTMPEDWDFSRKLHRLGAKVLCTREVATSHMENRVPFSNQDPVGDEEGWEMDQDHRWKFDPTIKDVPKVQGWLREKEGRFLAALAREQDVLEIGSWKGLSTIWIARAANKVTCVDTFVGGTQSVPQGDVLSDFIDNLKKYEVQEKVSFIVGRSKDVLKYHLDKYDFVFIDGDHDKESVLSDIHLSERLLKPDGLLVLHDVYSGIDPGVTAAVDTVIADGEYELVTRCETIGVIKPIRYKTRDIEPLKGDGAWQSKY